MMGDDLDAGMAVEQAGEHEAAHRHRRLIGPAEAPPHLVARFLLRRVVGHVGGARRVQPDRQVVLGHRGEERAKLRQVERLAGDVGEDLHAARAEVADGALGFRDGRVDVGQRDCRHEGGEALGMLRAQLRHGVVADPRQRFGGLALGEVLDRRIGQADDLAIVAEFVHLAKARVEIEQLLHAAQPRSRCSRAWARPSASPGKTGPDRCGNRCR